MQTEMEVLEFRCCANINKTWRNLQSNRRQQVQFPPTEGLQKKPEKVTKPRAARELTVEDGSLSGQNIAAQVFACVQKRTCGNSFRDLLPASKRGGDGNRDGRWGNAYRCVIALFLKINWGKKMMGRFPFLGSQDWVTCHAV